MVVADGYCIEYYKKENMIIIKLPPTMETINSTIMVPADRKLNFTDEELNMILLVAKSIAERK